MYFCFYRGAIRLGTRLNSPIDLGYHPRSLHWHDEGRVQKKRDTSLRGSALKLHGFSRISSTELFLFESFSCKSVPRCQKQLDLARNKWSQSVWSVWITSAEWFTFSLYEYSDELITNDFLLDGHFNEILLHPWLTKVVEWVFLFWFRQMTFLLFRNLSQHCAAFSLTMCYIISPLFASMNIKKQVSFSLNVGRTFSFFPT